MAKSRARLLAELLNSEGLVKKSKSALAGSDEVIDLSALPTITNAKLENSSISIAGHSTALGGSVSLDTADITEHNDYKYYTDTRARTAISVSGSLSYNSTTGVISYTTPTTIASLSNHDTADLAEGTNLYYTDARARAAISVSGNALSYNSTTGVITANYEESPTFTGTVTVGDSAADALVFTGILKQGLSGGVTVIDSSRNLTNIGNITLSGTVDGRDIATDGTKLDGIESGATADQTQAEINALGITAIGLSGTPNITVGTISSGTITSSGNFVATSGYVNTAGAYSSGDYRVLNAAGDGWHVWADRVNGNFNLDVGTISSGDITVSKGGTAGTDYPKLTLTNSIESSAWSIGHTLGEIQFYNSDAQNAGPTAVIRNVNSNPDNQTTIYGNLEFLTTDPFDLDAVTSIMNVGITRGSRPSVYIGVEGPSYISNHQYGLGNLVIASSAGIAPSNSTLMTVQFAPTIRLEHMSDHNDWDSGDVIGQILFGANDHTTNDEVRARIIVEQDTDNQFTTDSRIVFETAAVDASTSEVLRLDSSKNATFANDVTISGNLYVTGSTTSVNVEDLNVEQGEITLNYGSGDTSAAANGAGIRIQDAVDADNDATILWDATNDKFDFSHAINVTGNIAVSGTVDGRDIASDGTKLDGIESGATADQTAAEILTAIKTVDGSGSGLDADLLDGLSSASFLRADADDLTSGNITISKTSPTIILNDNNTSTSTYPAIQFDTSNGQGVRLEHNEFDGELPVAGYGLVLKESSNNSQFPTTGTLTFNVLGEMYAGATSLGSLNKVFHDGYHPNADTWTTARTITLGGDLTGSVSIDGSANVTLTATVTNDSHTHAFNNLTGKTSGTGEYSTDSHLTSGRGSGGVSLTINDGYGNANITWNHKSGVPEQNGQAARIEVNTDGTSTEGTMSFEISSADVTANTAVSLPVAMTLAHDYLEIPNIIRHAGDTNTYIQFDDDRVRIIDGGGTYLDTNNGSAVLHTSTTFGGDVSGTYNAIVVADDSHNHIISNVDGLQTALDAKAPLSAPDFTGEVYTNASQDAWAFRSTTGSTSNSSGLWFTGTVARLLLRDSSGNILTSLAANGTNSQNIINGNTIWHAGNDGSGSGLDADLLDGISSASFLRSDANDTFTGTLTTGELQIFSSHPVHTGYSGIANTEAWTTTTGQYMIISSGTDTYINGDSVYIRGGNNSVTNQMRIATGGTTIGGNTVWHAGNDGSGSGLDADTVDGLHASSFLGVSSKAADSDLLDGIDSTQFLRSDTADVATGQIQLQATNNIIRVGNTDNTSTAETTGLNLHGNYTTGQYAHRFTKKDHGGGVPLYIDGSGGTANVWTHLARFGAYSGNSYELEVFGDINATGNLYDSGNAVWHAGNDGSGSGLDADLLDGQQGSYYAPATGGSYVAKSGDSMSGELNITYNTGITGTSAPTYSNGQIEVQTSSNHVPAIGFHRGGYSATTLYEYDGELYTNAWTTRAQTGKLISSGNLLSYMLTVDGSGSGLDADTVDGLHASSFIRSDAADTVSGVLSFSAQVGQVEDKAYLEFYVHGSSESTFYPVVIGGASEGYAYKDYSISRRYNWTAPSSWNTSTHMGALTLTWQHSSDTAWGGNDKEWRVIQFDEVYTQVCQGLELAVTGGMVVWLRGGGSTGARYRLHSPKGSQASVTIYDGTTSGYSGGGSHNSSTTFTAGNNVNYVAESANTTTRDNRINPRWPVRDRGYLYHNGNAVWHTANDGSGSGLDADLLDGQQGSYYAPASTAVTLAGTQTITGTKTFDGSSSAPWRLHVSNASGSWDALTFQSTTEWGDGTTQYGVLGGDGTEGLMLRNPHIVWNAANGEAGIRLGRSGGTSSGKWVGMGVKASNVGYLQMETTNVLTWDTSYNVNIPSGNLTRASNTVWDAGNDGSGSGLDADTLDGVQATGFLYRDVTNSGYNINLTTDAGSAAGLYVENSAGAFRFQLYGDGSNYGFLDAKWASWDLQKAIGGNLRVDHGGTLYTVWDAYNDGSGSTLDADLLDGLHASSFLRSDTTNSLYRVTAGDGNRLRFWDSDSYAIWMSSAGNGTWGGRVPYETTSDYNMYFRMSSGTNRGFVFQNSTTEVAGIDSSGNLRVNGVISSDNKQAMNCAHWSASGTSTGAIKIALPGTTANYSMPVIEVTTYDYSAKSHVIYNISGHNWSTTSYWYNTRVTSEGGPPLTVRLGHDGTTHCIFIGETNTSWSYGSVTVALKVHPAHYASSQNFTSGWGISQVTSLPSTITAVTVGTIWHSTNDGSGSGLDADLLDGIHASSFLRSDTADTFTGALTVTGNIGINGTAGTGYPLYVQSGQRYLVGLKNTAADANYPWLVHETSSSMAAFIVHFNGVGDKLTLTENGNLSTSVQGTVWGASNDGSGSTLDADLLDGQHGSHYLDYNNFTNKPTLASAGTNPNNLHIYNTSPTIYFRDTNGLPAMLHNNSDLFYILRGNSNATTGWTTYDGTGGAAGWPLQVNLTNSGHYFNIGSPNVNAAGNKVWHAGNDGSGSTLDADLLDGNHASAFPLISGTNTWGTNGINYFRVERGATSGSLNTANLQVYTTGANSAYMSFHRSGSYAVNFGLDSDNILRIGGWSASANRWVLDMSGNMTAAGNVTAYSDIRLKENIEIIPNALEKVKQIRGVTFTRNDQEDKEAKHTGVIAQEVEKVLPEVVSEDNLGIKNVAYGNMVGLLIEAIKEQQETIEKLTKRIEELEK